VRLWSLACDPAFQLRRDDCPDLVGVLPRRVEVGRRGLEARIVSNLLAKGLQRAVRRLGWSKLRRFLDRSASSPVVLGFEANGFRPEVAVNQMQDAVEQKHDRPSVGRLARRSPLRVLSRGLKMIPRLRQLLTD
jgi:hypothetical protein